MDSPPPGRRGYLRRITEIKNFGMERFDMNVYEIKSMHERLDGNTYPGRGIIYHS